MRRRTPTHDQMTRTILTALLALTISACATQRGGEATSQAAATPAGRAPLVVLVVIDQLSTDLFERYADLYKGGFRRLIDQGRYFPNASHNHAVTVTAVGHAALVTGVSPSRHGIVSNAWVQRSGGQWAVMANIGDSTVQIVGHPTLPGASPRNLQRPGFADWLLAASPGSQIASVSGKDRGAILPVTRAKGHVYWFEGLVGQFVTSTYYATEPAAWARSFNETRVPSYRGDSVWRSAIPASLHARSKPDTAAEENDGVRTYFPHSSPVPERFWTWFESTPSSDAAALEFAKTMVSSLGLGRDATPDFLNVSLSATDAVGHIFGPHSREQLDNLLRLDARLGEFFEFLDGSVGKGRWIVAFSADHGIAEMPEDLRARGQYGHRITPEQAAALTAIRARAESAGVTPAVRAEAVAAVKRFDFVADAWTHDDLMASPRDSFAILMARSIYPGRVTSSFGRIGIEVRLKPGVLSGPRGSSHGSPYWYDRNVPMIIMGPGIAPRRDPAFVYTVDMGPTLAGLVGVPVPRDLDGRRLELSR